MYFHFRSMRISFISKVTRVHKAATAANDTSLCSTILVVFLGFHPGRPGWNLPYEQTSKFLPVTEPARLPGLYEEALSYMACVIVICSIKILNKRVKALVRRCESLFTCRTPQKKTWTPHVRIVNLALTFEQFWLPRTKKRLKSFRICFELKGWI